MLFWLLLGFKGFFGVSAEPLPVTHYFERVPVVIIDPSAPTTKREVKKALRWWDQRCLASGEIRQEPCSAEEATPGSICITELPPEDQAFFFEKFGTVPAASTFVARRAANADQAIWAHISLGKDVGFYALVHELGHALAFDHPDKHHTPPGTPMAPTTDSVGPHDGGINLCVR